MAVKLNSYISFKDNAREAAEYYHGIFGGELTLSTFEEYASPEMPVADDEKHKIMHAALMGEGGVELYMADTPNEMPFQDGARISLALNGSGEALLRGYWDKLAADGTVTMPLDKAPWGDTFGMLTDKFGINWMVDIESPKKEEA